jgi:hypothetical protein
VFSNYQLCEVIELAERVNEDVFEAMMNSGRRQGDCQVLFKKKFSIFSSKKQRKKESTLEPAG